MVKESTPSASELHRSYMTWDKVILQRFSALDEGTRTNLCALLGTRDTRLREIFECRYLHNPDRTLASLGAQFHVSQTTIRSQTIAVLRQLDTLMWQQEYALLKDKPEEVSRLNIRALGLSSKGTRRLQRLGYTTIHDLELPNYPHRRLRLNEEDHNIFCSKMAELGYTAFVTPTDPFSGTQDQVLDREISKFPLSVRARKAISRNHCTTVRDFLNFDPCVFLQYRNFGRKTQCELNNFRTRILAIAK